MAFVGQPDLYLARSRTGSWDGVDGTGENGHGSAVIGSDGLIHLVYQERAGEGQPWRILRATTEPAAVCAALGAARPRRRARELAALRRPA